MPMQQDFKKKLEDFFEKNKRMPTYSEMMKLFGFKSKNAVFKLVDKMIDAGLVVKDKLGKIIPSESFNGIPLLGSVKAGFPTEVEEDTSRSVNLDDMLVKNKGLTYLLEVDGDSMIDAHIKEGDMVLVERRNIAKQGDIVIAEIDGEFTMKYYRVTDGKPWLEPANKNYEPIYPKYDLKINAVVKAVIRKY